MLEVGLEVEDTSGTDAALQDIVEELGDVPAQRRYAAAQPDVAEDHGVDRHLDAMRSADRAHDRTGPCDGERRGHRLTRTDALQGGVDADPTCQPQDRSRRGLATFSDDVRRAGERAISCRDGFRLSAMTRAAPSRHAAMIAHSPTAPSPTTATTLPGRTPPLTAA